MKKKISILIVAFVGLVTLGNCAKNEQEEPVITSTTDTLPVDIRMTITPDATNILTFYATAAKLTVDWGDGTTEDFTNVNIHNDAVTHTYTNNEKHSVTIWTQGLTEIGNDITHHSPTVIAFTNRHIAGSVEKITFTDCPDLKNVYIFNMELTEVDMNGAPQVETIWLTGCNLTTLNLTGCTALTILNCSGNALGSLDLSHCTALTYIDCHSNQLTSLDLSHCTALTELYCYSNQLTSLDIAPNNGALAKLVCSNNQLDADALNDLFTKLPDRSLSASGGRIIYFDNPGFSGCDFDIARRKNWLY